MRRTLGVPYMAHRHILPLLVQGRSFAEQLKKRVFKFVQLFVKSPNGHVRLIGERARYSATGALDRNWVRCEVLVLVVLPHQTPQFKL